MQNSLWNRAIHRLTRNRHAPSIKVKRCQNLIHLGTRYGGWTFENSPDLQNATIVSGGVGEDASFDVEFAAKFNAKVILIDPTPRAIRHLEEIKKRIPQPARTSYATNGQLSPDSYDLSKLSADSLILKPYALWFEVTKLKFFAPPDPSHVSHSIANFQKSGSQEAAYIEVPTTTLENILTEHGLKTVPLMKVDIEGAEIEVFKDMLEKSIYPRQLLVEFHWTRNLSDGSKKKVEETDAALRKAGYECRHFNGSTNYLYVRAA